MANNQSKIEIILSSVDHGLTTGLKRATSQVKAFFSSSKQVESGVASVGRSVSGVLASLGATVSVAAGMQKLVGVSREFDKISAGLVTATGSAEGSQQAFAAVQDFATRTPYDLAQVTDSFIKLVNFGLDPSERALTSYGNTSSALGKSLNQMIEAVADAATGEFERLKEFGIKASKEGDKVTFTFRGVSTTVKNNAREIEEYLIKLGETNFGDAMANRMKTLDGALSNLGDEWNKVFLNISRAGIGDAIADGVRVGISALEELNAQIVSGEMEGNLRANAGQFAGWGEDIKQTLNLVTGWWRDFASGLDADGKDTVEGMSNAFSQFPENVRAFVGIATVYVAAEFDKIVARASDFKEWFKATFTNFSSTWQKGQVDREFVSINTARDATVDSILDRRAATIKAAADERAAAKQLRAEYESQQATSKANTADKLAQFRVQTAATQTSAKEEAKAKKEASAAAFLAAAEAKKEYQEQKKIAAEKMRAASQEKILSLEKEKIAASQLPTELARAEAGLAIDRRIMDERVLLKRQELAAIKEDREASQADIIRAESELAELLVQNETQLNDRLRDLAGKRMDDVETSWRRGVASAQEYQAAVRAALAAGAIDEDQANERLIGSGDDMGAAFGLGIKKARERMQSDGEVMIYLGEQIGDRISDGLVSAWDAFITGSKSAGEALADFARSTLSWIAQVILQQMIMTALFGQVGAPGGGGGGGGGGSGQAVGWLMGFLSSMFADGGLVQALATGGKVGGWSPHSRADNVPIWATAGEFMQPVRAVDYYGLDFMERIRRLQLPRHIAHALAGGTVPSIPSGWRLADGGQVPGQAPATTVNTGETRLNVINVIDKNMIGDFMKTHAGETAIINLIRRNSAPIKSVLK